jgi:cysteine desulfurase/selenocysteine lyase
MQLAKEKQCKLVFAGELNQVPTENDIIQKVNQKTRVIVFANISNLLGYELDAQKISHQAKQKNSKVIIVCDATQLLPHKLIDVKTTNIDFLVASAHKMCGPTGVGMFYMKSIYFNKLIPLRLGGGMNNEVKHNHFTYANGYEKFEGGTPHTAGIIG